MEVWILLIHLSIQTTSVFIYNYNNIMKHINDIDDILIINDK